MGFDCLRSLSYAGSGWVCVCVAGLVLWVL